MPYQSFTPAFPLAEFVDTIWWMSNDGTVSSRQRICPNGAMALVIHLAGKSLSFFEGANLHNVPTPLLAGPWSKSFLIDPTEFTAVLGVRFKPGAARFFFPVPAHELHNVDVPLRDFYPDDADRLLEELSHAGCIDHQFRRLEGYLLERLGHGVAFSHPSVESAVHEFTRYPGMRAISEVQSATGLSHTRFIQVFRESVGITPKLFCRLQRFGSVLQQIEKGLPVNWAALAADCGYFDQAHLIHDFKAFAGLTPVEYTRQRPAGSRAAAAPSS